MWLQGRWKELRNALKSDGKNATMETFFRDCFKVMTKLCERTRNGRDCKLITCQQNNLKGETIKKRYFQIWISIWLWEIKVTRMSQSEWMPIMIRFYLNSCIETFRLFGVLFVIGLWRRQMRNTIEFEKLGIIDMTSESSTDIKYLDAQNAFFLLLRSVLRSFPTTVQNFWNKFEILMTK